MVREKAKIKKTGKKIAVLKIKRMKIEDLVPADYNPRTITEDALVGLGKSVEEFGLVESLVWNERSGRLVSGHQRLKVLARQCVDEVDVSVVDLDDAREKMLNLTLNNTIVHGAWDIKELSNVLDDLKKFEIADEIFGDLKLSELFDSFHLSDEMSTRIGDDVIPECFEIVIRCDNEEEQIILLKEFLERDLKCRALVS